ncbi:adenylate/guanylate cyclase domain-containing protein [Bradyrhizobium guangdongense]|uniref:adenylate/guanylate cyclase domain-containing protein n=1 Tax=Bradyrhizobium guangdongense TaxID=1325090 RepID=UPI0011287D94|nr:adenylate/guanylate cyclase domain-containing protein [Bradyrhizobium guangdongense]TPQ39111.1 adenylate/guanylate cyclase domain-containing protein [Bradyrhizobium guangdongense]
MKYRDILTGAAAALVCGIAFASPAFEMIHGLSIDTLTAVRARWLGDRRDPSPAPVVVVAIDEETYQTPPFQGSPTQTWTREIGRVLTAMIDGGAKVVGLDVIFPTSIEQSEIPYGDELLGARLRGFDRDFLRALATGAAAGKVVLGEIQSRDQPVRPAPAQRFAVRQQSNIRALNVYTDSDDVVRRLPLMFEIGGKPVPSMAVELTARALKAEPILAPGGIMTLAGYEIPSTVPNTLTLNFRGGGEDVPTFSFADLHACVAKDDREFFHRHFDGKVVIVGTLLDFDDRRLTSKRFVTGLDSAGAPRCAQTAHPAPRQVKRSSIAGVYIHATAASNLINRNAVVEPGRLHTTLIAIAFAGLAAVAARILAPVAATLTYLGCSAAYVFGAAVAFTHSPLALPLTEPIFAGLAALAIMIGYRLVVADQEERFLRKSFALYLAPQVIDGMLSSEKMPELGGEMRNVTVFFSDVAGFSTFSERMSPGALVALMNEYLSAMTDIIESYGGYVDKYVGDSIVAVFGAPVSDPEHACNAVRAALRCSERLEELNKNNVSFQGYKLAHRVGLNSGDALVGNIGSRRRFNYTVMSDAVNVASRLEGANKYFGSSIMASEMTVALTGGTFAWRELDAIRVKGRSDPVKIYEPLAESGKLTPEQSLKAAAYAEGLACWRAREFGRAVDCFARMAATDRPSALFRERAKRLADNPPPPEWEPINTLEGK